MESYLIFKGEFKDQNIFNWIKNHIMGAPPPHRFKGDLQVEMDELVFSGFDLYLKKTITLNIKKYNISQIYHGFDEVFHSGQIRSFGLAYQPIRLTLEDEASGEMNFLYIVAVIYQP